MSNAKRPTLQRKPSTKAVVSKKEDVLNSGFRITVDGTPYEVRYGDLTPALTRELRAKTGVGWNGLQAQLAVDPDIDLVSAFVWLARRAKGERVEFEDVNVSYGDMFDMEEDDIEVISGEPEVTDDPEA